MSFACFPSVNLLGGRICPGLLLIFNWLFIVLSWNFMSPCSWWSPLVTPATRDAEATGSQVQGKPRRFSKTLCQNKMGGGQQHSSVAPPDEHEVLSSIPRSKKKKKAKQCQKGWQCSLIIEHLPNMLETLSSIHSTKKRKLSKEQVFSVFWISGFY